MSEHVFGLQLLGMGVNTLRLLHAHARVGLGRILVIFLPIIHFTLKIKAYYIFYVHAYIHLLYYSY